MVNNA